MLTTYSTIRHFGRAQWPYFDIPHLVRRHSWLLSVDEWLEFIGYVRKCAKNRIGCRRVPESNPRLVSDVYFAEPSARTAHVFRQIYREPVEDMDRSRMGAV